MKNFNGVITLAVSKTGTLTGTCTDVMQKPFTLAGTRTGHLKAIEISLKHTI